MARKNPAVFQTLILITFLSSSAFANSSTSKEAPAADNSRLNKRDQRSDEMTAGQQASVKSDVEITRSIRKKLISDKSLSTYAHNIKIITDGGQVILKGPVRSEQERSIVEKDAIQVAGADHVKCQVDISPKN